MPESPLIYPLRVSFSVPPFLFLLFFPLVPGTLRRYLDGYGSKYLLSKHALRSGAALPEIKMTSPNRLQVELVAPSSILNYWSEQTDRESKDKGENEGLAARSECGASFASPCAVGCAYMCCIPPRACPSC